MLLVIVIAGLGFLAGCALTRCRGLPTDRAANSDDISLGGVQQSARSTEISSTDDDLKISRKEVSAKRMDDVKVEENEEHQNQPVSTKTDYTSRVDSNPDAKVDKDALGADQSKSDHSKGDCTSSDIDQNRGNEEVLTDAYEAGYVEQVNIQGKRKPEQMDGAYTVYDNADLLRKIEEHVYTTIDD